MEEAAIIFARPLVGPFQAIRRLVEIGLKVKQSDRRGPHSSSRDHRGWWP